MGQTDKAEVRMTPATLADLMRDPVGSKHGLGMGRTWTVSDGAKRVRSIARDTIDRFVNRTGRTMHAYTLAEARVIVAESARAVGGGNTASADAIRTAAAPKATPKAKRAPKAAPKAADTAQDAS